MPRLLRRLLWFAEWVLAAPMLLTAPLLTAHAAEAAARLFGRAAFALLAGDRAWALGNLRLAFGNALSEPARRRLAAAVFEHHARMFLEILRMTAADVERRLVVEGLEHVPALSSTGRGVIAVSGRLGNFEILAGVFSRRGMPCTMLARPLDNPFFEATLRSHRARYGNRTLPRTPAGLREALRRLARGEALGIAVDQNARVGGVFVDFLGVPAATAPGAAQLVLRYGCPAALLVTHRLPDGRHRVVLGPPIAPVRTGDADADVAATLRAFTAALEPHVLAWPGQYHWQHPRWRTRPDGSHLRTAADLERLAAEPAARTGTTPDGKTR